jgi:hypothetical protein
VFGRSDLEDLDLSFGKKEKELLAIYECLGEVEFIKFMRNMTGMGIMAHKIHLNKMLKRKGEQDEQKNQSETNN